MIPVDVVCVEGEDTTRLLPPSARFIRTVSSQIAAMRKELRLGLPVLNKDDLRRYRMYDAGSVLLELVKSGEGRAAQSLWQVLQLDGASRTPSDATRTLRRPALANCPELLHALAVGLAASSKASRDGDRGSAGAHLVQLSEVARSRGLSWWWLSDYLLELATVECAGWRQDGGLCEATTALAYGSFLLYELRECGESLPKLTLAAQLSAGKGWTPSPTFLRLLPEELHRPHSGSVDMFQVVSHALSEALVLEARIALKAEDHGRASALCREAVQRAHDARSSVLELRAERELGDCLLAAGQATEAASTFMTYLAIARETNSPRDVVKAHLKLALCYNSQSEPERTLQSLRDAKLAAEELNQPDLLAKAHSHLGEFFLNTTRFPYATNHFHQACRLYNDSTQRDRVRTLAGVTGGLELWESLVRAVRDCDPEQPSALRRQRLLQLTAWQDRRAPFWPDTLPVSVAVRGLQLQMPPPGTEENQSSMQQDKGRSSGYEEHEAERKAITQELQAYVEVEEDLIKVEEWDE